PLVPGQGDPDRTLARELALAAPEQSLSVVTDTSALTAAPAGPAPRPPAHQVLVIDPSVRDYQTLLTGLSADVQPVVLNAYADGVAQISEVLVSRHDVSALHILSHGSGGSIHLGNTRLGRDTLDKYAPDLRAWGQSLTGDGDILIYGCDVAAGPEG